MSRLFIIALMIGWGPLYAQTAVEGKLYIDSASVVNIDSDLLIKSGEFENKGNMYFSGDMSNNGTFISGDGANLIFTGNNQVFDGGTYRLSSLLVGDGGVTNVYNALLVEILDSLNLSEGIIYTLPEGAVKLNLNAKSSEGSEISYIDGALYRSDEGKVIYPIGVDGSFTPVTLEKGEGEMGLIAHLQTGQPDYEEDIFGVSEDRYWEILPGNNNLDIANAISLPIKDEVFIRNFFDIVVAGAGLPEGVYKTQERTDLDETDRWNKEGIVFSKLDGQSKYLALAEKVNNEVFVKNMISPNGDLKNDFLYIENIEKFEGNEVLVLNRWGQEVFRQAGYQNNWDATVNGTPLPTGTYTCIVKINGVNGPETFVSVVNIINK